MLMQAQLRWTGHVTRMQHSLLPKQMFYSELQSGKRSRGRPRKRYKDTLKNALQSVCINTNSWVALAYDGSWRSTVKSGALQCEQRNKTTADQRRGARKHRKTSPPQRQSHALTAPDFFAHKSAYTATSAPINSPVMFSDGHLRFDGQTTTTTTTTPVDV